LFVEIEAKIPKITDENVLNKIQQLKNEI
jgi:hypothetical protein